jgi:hypothetical protein
MWDRRKAAVRVTVALDPGPHPRPTGRWQERPLTFLHPSARLATPEKLEGMKTRGDAAAYVEQVERNMDDVWAAEERSTDPQ